MRHWYDDEALAACVIALYWDKRMGARAIEARLRRDRGASPSHQSILDFLKLRGIPIRSRGGHDRLSAPPPVIPPAPPAPPREALPCCPHSKREHDHSDGYCYHTDPKTGEFDCVCTGARKTA